jgi:hypothetical protein
VTSDRNTALDWLYSQRDCSLEGVSPAKLLTRTGGWLAMTRLVKSHAWLPDRIALLTAGGPASFAACEKALLQALHEKGIDCKLSRPM